MAKANGKRRPISLALQGGGVHGAYTWGVLDRLREDESLNIAAISATSAGAMNAVAYAAGLARGGPEGARAELEALWRRVSESSAALGAFGQAGIAFAAALQSLASPYDLNPFNSNPLRRLVHEQVDFDAVRASGLTLFISATNVETGKSRVFAFVQRLLDDGMLKAPIMKKYRRLNVHAIRGGQDLIGYGLASKYDTRWRLLTELRDIGRAEADRWLRECAVHVGTSPSSFNIRKEFLDA